MSVTAQADYGIQSLEDLETVKAFFYCRMGSGFGFRFKDWGDFERPLGALTIRFAS